MLSLMSIFLNEKDSNTDVKEPKNKEKNKDPKVEDPDMDDPDVEGTGKKTDNEEELFDDVDDEGLDLENNKDDDETPEDNPDEEPTDDTDTTDDLGDDTTDDTTDDLGDTGDDLGDDNSTDDLGGDDSTDDSLGDDSTEEDNSPTQDKINKLLQSFNTMYNDCEEIISSINTSNKNNDPLEYKTLTNVVDNLQNLKNTMYDYIINKYKKKSYEENLYTYYSMLYSIKKTQQIVEKIIEIRNKA